MTALKAPETACKPEDRSMPTFGCEESPRDEESVEEWREETPSKDLGGEGPSFLASTPLLDHVSTLMSPYTVPHSIATRSPSVNTSHVEGPSPSLRLHAPRDGLHPITDLFPARTPHGAENDALCGASGHAIASLRSEETSPTPQPIAPRSPLRAPPATPRKGTPRRLTSAPTTPRRASRLGSPASTQHPTAPHQQSSPVKGALQGPGAAPLALRIPPLARTSPGPRDAALGMGGRASTGCTPRHSMDGVRTPGSTPSRASTPHTPQDAAGLGPGSLLAAGVAGFGRAAGLECPASPNAKRTNLPENVALSSKRVLVNTSLRHTASFQNPGVFRFNDHFDFLGLIGRSTYSEVYKVKHSRTNDVYAVKLLTKKLVSRTDRERALREVKVVADLPEHPNVVSYYRGWQEDRRLHIQMEYCPRGTLSGMLAGYQAKRTLMPELEVWRVARDVAGALGFIHAHGIVHLDLKPDNIFVCDKTFKLGDFGLAISLRSGGRVEWEEGDGDYVAPELLSSSTTLPTPAADMYSLGATLYECATGMRLPRGGRSAGLPVTLPHSSCGLGKLVRSLLVADPGARLTAQEVLDGINNLLGNRLPPIPQLRRDSKGWGAFPMADDMCEDSFAPGSACSDCSSLDSDGHGGAAWAADDTSALDDMVGGITNGTRPPRALYVDVDAARCAPAGPGPSSGRAVGAPRGIRRSPAGGRKSPSMGWHSHLQRLTTRSVSMRALSPSPADPYGMQRVWMKSPNSTASTPRGWAGLGGGLGGLGGEDADDSHHGLARSVGGSDPALGRLWRGVGQGHGMDGVGRTSVGCLYSIREENRKSAKEAADQLLGVTSSPVVPIMERMSLSGARNVGNGGDRPAPAQTWEAGSMAGDKEEDGRWARVRSWRTIREADPGRPLPRIAAERHVVERGAPTPAPPRAPLRSTESEAEGARSSGSEGEQGRGGISRALFRGPSFSDKRSSSLPGSVISQLARRQALAELPTIAVHHSSIGEAPPGSCVAISSELPLLAAPGKTLTQRGAGIDVDMEGTQAGWPAGKGAWISGTGSGTRTPSAAESLSLFESEMGAPTGPADGADEMMLDPSGQSGPRRPMKMMHRRSVSVQDDMGLPRKVGLASMGDNLADDGSDLSL